MKVDLLLAVLAILGIIGYVFLFLGTAEPRHRHGNLFLTIVAFSLINNGNGWFICSVARRVRMARSDGILCYIRFLCIHLPHLCSQRIASLALER